ncbi:MAG: PDZ domain-containing protein, partial [Clostridia bacterium]|nr:PDZ domain-containing protein [Clostridia bacterium]
MIRKTIIFLMIISLFTLPSFAASVGDTVYVGGMTFGVKFYTDGVLVCGVSEVDSDDGNVSPGDIAGLKKGDIITRIDDTDITNLKDILNILKLSEGKPLNLCVMRNSTTKQLTVTPVRSVSEDCYKLGLWLKDGTSGIGTVTYIEDNGNFAGLGHGVCDSESGELLKMREAKVTDVTVTGVKISRSGEPGNLQGVFINETG